MPWVKLNYSFVTVADDATELAADRGRVIVGKPLTQIMAEEEEELVELSAEELASLRHSTVDVPLARGWSSATFACHHNPSSCLLACVCPCVQFGLNQRAAFGASCFKWSLLWLLPLIMFFIIFDTWVAPSDSAADEAVRHVEQSLHEAAGTGSASSAHEHMDRSTIFFYAMPAAMALVGIVGMIRRHELRRKYGIGGTMLGDFCCHFCCACCSLAKEAREIRRQMLEEVVAGASVDLHDVQIV